MFKFSVNLNENIFFNFYILYIVKGIITIDVVIDYTEFRFYRIALTVILEILYPLYPPAINVKKVPINRGFIVNFFFWICLQFEHVMFSSI